MFKIAPAKKYTFLSATAVLALFVAPAVHAQVPNLITPGDTFSYDILGYNTASGNGYFVTYNNEATFGTTTTFAGDGIDGQDITVSSSEVIGATTTTDTFTISTPTSFIMENSLYGLTVTGLEFDLGNANSGSDPVNVAVPITTFTSTGSTLYNTNTNQTLTPGTDLDNGGLAYEAVEAIQSGTNPIAPFNVRRFTYAITYATLPVAVAPEPSQFAALAIGLLGLGALALKARKRLAA